MNSKSATRTSPRALSPARWLFLVLAFVALSATEASAQFNRLMVFSPAGFETLVVDSVWNIRWYVPTGMTKLLKIEYSVDSGLTWKHIDTMTARPGMDTLPWVVPNDTTHLGMVRVSTTDDSSTAKSRNVFTISAEPPKTVRVTYPNGGERFKLDSLIKIRWTSSNVSGTLTVELSVDSGATWRTLFNNLPARNGADSVEWTVSGDTTSKAFVRVSIPSLALTDRSNRTFTIRPNAPAPRIVVYYPNGGERFAVDSVVMTRWMGEDLTGTLQVEYSTDSGQTYKPIATVPARNGSDSLSWTIPNDTTSKAFFRVRSESLGVSDVSNRTFSIRATPYAPWVRLVYPNGGETLKGGAMTEIRWIGGDLSGQARAEFSADSGATWSIAGVKSASGGIDTLRWRLPNISTTQALMRVVVGFSAADTSDATFTIEPTPVALSLVAPLAGDRIVTDSVVAVKWASTGIGGSRVTLTSLINDVVDTVGSVTVPDDGLDSMMWTAPSEPYDGVRLTLYVGDSLSASVGPFSVIARPTGASPIEPPATRTLSAIPNPASSSLRLSWEGAESASLTLTAANGGAVLHATLRNGGAIDCSRLAPGSYVAVVRHGGSVERVRVVVLR